MQIFYPFVIGILASITGTLLPGLLNATVVKIACDEGRKKAELFMAGCLTIIFFQAYLAIFFAKIIDNSQVISNIIQEIGFVVFVSLTVFFLVKNRKTRLKKINLSQTKNKKRFFYGMLLALLNVFPIPYYVFVSISAAKSNLFIFKLSNNVSLSLGVILGTYITFRFYMFIFRNKSVESSIFLKNINLILAAITGLVALLTLYKLIPQFI